MFGRVEHSGIKFGVFQLSFHVIGKRSAVNDLLHSLNDDVLNFFFKRTGRPDNRCSLLNNTGSFFISAADASGRNNCGLIRIDTSRNNSLKRKNAFACSNQRISCQMRTGSVTADARKCNFENVCIGRCKTWNKSDASNGKHRFGMKCIKFIDSEFLN